VSAVQLLLDAPGQRHSPATLLGYHAGRPARNKGMRYHADPSTISSTVEVRRETPDNRHGCRLRALMSCCGVQVCASRRLRH